MKLLILPYVAQREVLKQMEYEELLLISFLSKRSMTMIQSVKRKEMTDIEILINRYCYKFCAGSEKIVIATLYTETFESDDITLRKGTSLGNVVCSMEHKDREGFLRRYYPSLIIYYRHISEMDTLAEIVYNQLKALFGNYVTFCPRNMGRHDSLPTFLNVKRSSMSFSGRVDAQVLENYFTNVQKQERLRISLEGLNGNLSSNSKFYNTRELWVSCKDKSLTNDILSNFKGKELILNAPTDIDNEICQFIARWKSDETLKNFEHLQLITAWPGNTNVDDIKQRSGLKDLCPEANEYLRYSYVVRDDGIVAKMYINQRILQFYVQSFTEEQMLKGTEVVVWK
ncbi:unnamed protein product [Caenorhabditis brenneri]